MHNEAERRTTGGSRIPFGALVEVGSAALLPFEAQAVDVSASGMHLRTAHLPTVGQHLSCRFELSPGETVLAAGEVVWREDVGGGGEFGLRFTDVDAEGEKTLERFLVQFAVAPKPVETGSRVRLHIEGLGSPMRARVRKATGEALTVGSELGFLQVGRELSLENADTGAKRAAVIDRVGVEIDPESHVPQLVVGLKYMEFADGETEVAFSQSEPPARCKPAVEPSEKRHSAQSSAERSEEPRQRFASNAEPPSEHGRADEEQDIAERMKGAVARSAAKVTPALLALMKRAKTTAVLLAAKRRGHDAAEADKKRRTTALPPGGGLYASGRKVVRGEDPRDGDDGGKFPASDPLGGGKLKANKRTVAISCAAGLAALLVLMALRKPSPAPLASAPSAASSPAAPALPPPAAPEPLVNAAPPPLAPASTFPVSPGAAGSDVDAKAQKKRLHVTPFSNGGPVAHGNVLKLKMDGVIEKIHGAAQPTGFMVTIPGRRSIEAAGPLASRDSRIAAIKVSNDASGADLTVAFKDGVPNYQVRAKGDTLEIALAPIGESGASNDEDDDKDSTPATKHRKSHREHGGPTAHSKRHKRHHASKVE